MQKHAIFMDCKTEYGKDVSSPRVYLSVQCNSYRIPARCFVVIDKFILKFNGKAKPYNR